jgi:sigma-B regulation protein RsbU (phosphoserine phosphatase)
LFFSPRYPIHAGWLWTWRTLQARIRNLERSNEEIQVEETLVFDFLHGLVGGLYGDDPRGGSSSADRRRCGAHPRCEYGGGALHRDRTGTKLTPAYVSKGCPPLVEVPDHVAQQATSTPAALESFLRLQSVDVGQGIIGGAWQTEQPSFSRCRTRRSSRIGADGTTSVL